MVTRQLDAEVIGFGLGFDFDHRGENQQLHR